MLHVWNLVLALVTNYLNYAFSSVSGGMYLYREPRYQNRLPVDGLIDFSYLDGSPVYRCVAMCNGVDHCLAIFFAKNYCRGFNDIMQEHISMTPAPGVQYFEVSGPIHNIALNKPTTEGSVYTHFRKKLYSYKAVDGLRNGQFGRITSCFMAEKNRLTKYMYIDLQGRYFVTLMKIQTRAGCCFGKFTDVSISVSNDGLTWEECYYYVQNEVVPAGSFILLHCGKIGRFVKLENAVKRDFTVCEVEISGYPA